MGKKELINQLIETRTNKNKYLGERKSLSEDIKSCIETEDKLIRMLGEENEVNEDEQGN